MSRPRSAGDEAKAFFKPPDVGLAMLAERLLLIDSNRSPAIPNQATVQALPERAHALTVAFAMISTGAEWLGQISDIDHIVSGDTNSLSKVFSMGGRYQALLRAMFRHVWRPAGSRRRDRRS